jgi:ketopantoate reductase
VNAEITAIIGTGGIGSVIARHLASGGEALARRHCRLRWRSLALIHARPFIRAARQYPR